MKIAFPSDEHRPYQDDRAVELAMKITNAFNPDMLVVGSDGLDFYAVSSFDKNPQRMQLGLQKEVDTWINGQKAWRDAAPNAERRHIPGNHEDRLRKYLWRHDEIADLESMQLPNLLHFLELGILYDDHEYQAAEINIHNRLVIRHGRYVRKGSAMSARAELDSEMHSISLMTGHTHRGGSHYVRTRKGFMQAHEAFCLCRLDPEYVYRPDWQQGILLATVTNQFLSVEPVLFFDHKGKKAAFWREQLYLA